MVARRFFGMLVGLLGLAFATAVVAAPQVQVVPRGQPKTKAQPGPLPAAQDGMPDGAIARLGDSRLRHASLLTCVAFSPDGKRLVSGGADRAVRVWDVATGEAVNALQPPLNGVSSVRFTHGGRKLAVCFADGFYRFLDPATLQELSRFQGGISTEFAVSPDGSVIAAIATTGLLTVTELGSGLPKLELPPGGPFAFHPDNKSIAVAEQSGKVTLYRLAGGKPVATIDHGATVNALAFSPDGKRVATSGAVKGQEVVKVWELDAGRTQKPVAEIAGASQPKAWLGEVTIAARNGNAVGVYDLSAKKWVGLAKDVAGEWAVSPDGTKVAATGTGSLRVRIWDLASGEQLHAQNDTFPEPALIAPSADGRTVFVLSGDAAYLWPTDKSAAASAGTLPEKAVLAATGGGRLAVATAQAVLVYDDFDPAKPLPAKPAHTLTEHAKGCRVLAVSPDGKKVAYTGEAQRTVIADARTGATIRVLPVQTAGVALAFTPDGKDVAMIGRDSLLRLWSAGPVPEGAEDAEIWKANVQRSQKGTITVSPDGKRVAASSGGTLKVVNATNGRDEFSVGGLFEYGLFHHAAFSPDGGLLIAATDGTDGAVTVWEVATRSVVRHYKTGFGPITRLAVSADGTRMASAGAEEAITLWDLTGRHGKEAPTTDELLAAWAALDSKDGAKGYPAVRTLAAGGAKAMLIVATGMAKVLDRMKASGGTLPTELTGDTLRLFRIAQLLEDIGGEDERKLLGLVADLGGPAGDEAKAVLKRLEKR